MIEKVGNIVLDLSQYSGTDLYSEGKNEDELLEAVKYHTPEEYNQLITENQSWSFLYHLSHLRGNIVEWIPQIENADVLEIGAGCGAVTGAIAQKAKRVTCVELSKKRSLINAYRNQDQSNIEIKVGNFEDVEKHLSQKYDIITLIGVFEYAQSYINAEKPYLQFLNVIKKHLKKNGHIIIAIENKFGMKYWAGCREDHLGQYFVGIEGYSKTNGVRTFSKQELQQIFEECGFEKQEFFYPYPDYKLPVMIYSDEYLPRVGELQLNQRNFDGERVVVFDEAKVFDNIIRNNMFPFFSNSFLVILTWEDNK